MQRPSRGAFPVRPLLRRLIVASLGCVVLLGACVSHPTPTIEQQFVSTDAPPGCSETMCDYFFSSCMDPCTECWAFCGRQDDPANVVACADNCNATCTTTRDKAPPADRCKQELQQCRGTMRNTVCVDGLRNDMPEDAPACSWDMNVATCACGSDEVCLGGLDRLSPKCRQCNLDWELECLDKACKKELDAHFACRDVSGCSASDDCPSCSASAADVSTCFGGAQNDPKDVGRCYSGPRACWSKPLCPVQL